MASTAAGRGDSKSPRANNRSPPRQDDSKNARDATAAAAAAAKPEPSSNAEPAKPLAPPPRPGQQQSGNTPDFFANGQSGSLSLEPNPFEQSFGAPAPETPGGNKLPSVAHLTSPSSLLPGSGVTPFTWGGGSLRTGPLSPAMLSGPTGDYFSDTHHLRGGFPTPNESSLRTGLTPGGSGSMFPAPSPNSQAMYASMNGNAATPGTLDFHRTALSAAAAKREQSQTQQPAPQLPQPVVTSQPSEMPNGTAALKPDPKPPTGPFDPHDNDAANGLFMLARGRNGTQPPAQQAPYVNPPPQPVHVQPPPPMVVPQQQPNNTSPHMNGSVVSMGGSSARGASEAASAKSEESEQARPTSTRGKGTRNSTSAATNGRRKAEEPAGRAPANKKTKTNGAASVNGGDSYSDDDDGDVKHEENGTKSKMTDEEKRKNFLERNRVAALKCRQRKKQWLANLQTKVEVYGSENDALTAQITQLREEVVNLKTLLLAHKDCPVTQQQGLHSAFMQQTMEPYNAAQMNPYGMAAPLPNQPVMAGQGVNRRFS